MLTDRQSRIGGILGLRHLYRGAIVGNSRVEQPMKSEKGSLVMTPRTQKKLLLAC